MTYRMKNLIKTWVFKAKKILPVSINYLYDVNVYHLILLKINASEIEEKKKNNNFKKFWSF